MTAALVRLAGHGLPAAAKINLALHVTGQRADGYHTLSSLVAFAEVGDALSVADSDRDRFALSGPFAEALGASPATDNIVLKALTAARTAVALAGHDIGPLAIHLDKRLPVASGIGGGSADAAALLRLFAEAMPALAADLRVAGLRLGADVPMCLDGVPAVVEGIGEHSRPLPCFPEVACLLINPGVSVSTPDVFRRLQQRTNPPLPPVPREGFSTLAGLIDYLGETRNDLEVPAVALVPSIAVVARAVRDAGARFTRMSGSGATVFALFDGSAEAEAAALQIGAAHADWWVAATRLKPAGPLEDIR